MQPPPYTAPPYPPPPARRGNRALVIGLVAGFLLLLLLAALLVVLATSHRGTPGKVRGTLQFRKVLAMTTGACPAGRVPSVKGDACYQLGDGMTITRVKRIEMRPPEGGNLSYSVVITLRPEDAGRLGTLTNEVAREQQPRNALAIVADGKVASAPQVMEPITGGTVMLNGSFTRAEAQRYVDLVEH